MAVIDLRKGKDGAISYRVRVRVRGRGTITRTFRRKTDAKDWASRTESDLKDGKIKAQKQGRSRRLSHLIDRYVADVVPQRPKADQVKSKTLLEWWKQELGDRLVIDITPSDISAARDKLAKSNSKYGKPLAPATVVRYLVTLSHVYTLAIGDWEWALDNPVSRIKKPALKNDRNRYLTVEEIAQLTPHVEASPCAYLPIIVRLAIFTGARRSEITNLTWADVDWKHARIYLRETKNGKPRSPVLLPSLVATLKKMQEVSPKDAVFVFARADGKKPLVFEKHWKAALVSSKIKDFRFHDLRHTFASHLAMNGATLMEIADALGQKTLQMVMRYAHLTEQHQAKRVHGMGQTLLEDIEKQMQSATHE